MAGCHSSHQPPRIREDTHESGEPHQRKLNFRLRTVSHEFQLPTENLSVSNFHWTAVFADRYATLSDLSLLQS